MKNVLKELLSDALINYDNEKIIVAQDLIKSKYKIKLDLENFIDQIDNLFSYVTNKQKEVIISIFVDGLINRLNNDYGHI